MEKNKAEQVIKILTEALPFIQKFSKKICVVKYGGAAMVEKDLKNGFARDIALMKQVGINVVVVHGGGPQIDKELKKFNIQRNFVDGIRVTDRNTIEVVANTLNDLVNKEIVSLINSNGGNSIGLAKNNNNLIRVKKLTSEKIDYGYVGEIIDIDSNYLYDLMNSNYIPVIAPLGFDENNDIYNINADSAASAIASNLAAEKLIFLTDQTGVLDQKGNLISSLNFNEIENLISSNVIKGGMLPKIKACLNSLKNNVKMAHIVDGRIQHSVLLEIFTNEGIGTLVKK
ncbi:MAG: acetylglutamate kinase [Gammaproteobacteria bacterium]|nr:acetylglutamate kinase [Gammaproteobacteria bacterium]